MLVTHCIHVDFGVFLHITQQWHTYNMAQVSAIRELFIKQITLMSASAFTRLDHLLMKMLEENAVETQ